LAASLPFALYGGYVTLESQTPPADHAFVAIHPDHQNAAMNAGYVVQWLMFALLTVAGFGYLAYREAHPNPDPVNPDPVNPNPNPSLNPNSSLNLNPSLNPKPAKAPIATTT
jgi:hypothetical protein